MPRRDFTTPSALPEETQTRCITIPASQQWLGLVNAALLMLTEAWRYEQVEATDMTPEATAARAYQMYVEYLGACDVACCPMRINPFNGRLQQSNDDGLTWFDVEDGPWTESLYPPFSAMPLPRPEATDDEKRCYAAATAANVLVNLYAQTGNTLLNVVAATDWEYAGALGAMLQGFLMMIGAAAVQPFVALASLLGVVGVRQQYVDYPLDGDDEEALFCILLDNATLEPSGAVTFDFQATWDAIDLDSPKNGLVRFLLTMIGPDALNYAGAIDAGITPDCGVCTAAWYECSFGGDGLRIWTQSSARVWSALPLVNGSYDSGADEWLGAYQGRVGGTGPYYFGAVIDMPMTAQVVTQIHAEGFVDPVNFNAGSSGTFSIVGYLSGSVVFEEFLTGSGAKSLTWSGSETLDRIDIVCRGANTNGAAYETSISKVCVRGEGDNPF